VPVRDELVRLADLEILLAEDVVELGRGRTG
jgi:hypothetical protein